MHNFLDTLTATFDFHFEIAEWGLNVAAGFPQSQLGGFIERQRK